MGSQLLLGALGRPALHTVGLETARTGIPTPLQPLLLGIATRMIIKSGLLGGFTIDSSIPTMFMAVGGSG